MAIRRGPTSFEEVVSDLRKDKKFRKAQRRVAPYFDRALEIIKRRVELGLTQKDLAEQASTFQSRISKIESGEHDIRLSTLIDIAEALQCEIAKNILVPIDDTEYEPHIDEFKYFLAFTSEVQEPQVEYTIKAEEYQPV
jgi:transcriptional regulator with XRE-family HTH domain